MPISSAARGTYRAGGGRFARPADLPASRSRSTPNLTAAGHHHHSSTSGTGTPTRHDCGATRAGSYTFRARPMPNFNLHDQVSPGHARAVYRKNHHNRRPPYGVDGDVHHSAPFYPPSVNPDSPEAIARLQRIREARKLYKTPATRRATAGSVDDLLKATKPERAPCSAVRHSHIHSERMYNLSASVPMHLHQLHHDHDHDHHGHGHSSGHGGGRRRRRGEGRGRLASNTSGSSCDGEPLGRRAVSSEVFVDDEASRVMGFTEATQTDAALSTDSLNESVRSDAAVMTDPEGLNMDRTPVDMSENRLGGMDHAAPFKLRPEEKAEETFPAILETDRELLTTTTEDMQSSAAVDSESDVQARTQAELEELRKIGKGRKDHTDLRPCMEEEIAAQCAERPRASNSFEKLLQEEDDTVTESATSSVGARSSILDSEGSEHDVNAKDELGEREKEEEKDDIGPRTMRANLTDLRHVEKRRSSLLKASGDDEDNEYFLLPGDQSITSELLSSQDPILDNRVSEWHHKSIFYQSKPIDGGAETEGIRVSAVQVSTTRVVSNPNARYDPPDLPVIVSSITYPMRQLYPLPNSNHFLSGPGAKSPVPSGIHITDSCLVYENQKPGEEKERLKWTVRDRRERLDGAMREKRSAIVPKESGLELQEAPDVIPRSRSPLEPSSSTTITGTALASTAAAASTKAQRPDHLNLVPNYPAVYLGASEQPRTLPGRPSALDFWRQKEAAYMKRNSLNTTVCHAFD